ncbi:hypothetical protein E2562_021648, partial [Oryza meyeriana var. granulata]
GCAVFSLWKLAANVWKRRAAVYACILRTKVSPAGRFGFIGPCRGTATGLAVSGKIYLEGG